MKKVLFVLLVVFNLFCCDVDNDSDSCFDIESLNSKIIQDMFYVSSSDGYPDDLFLSGKIEAYTRVLGLIEEKMR